jgi:tight adherence protein B
VKRAAVLLAVLAAAGAVAAATASAEPAPARVGLGLVETSNSGFPEKEYILSLPSQRKLTAESVDVLENGEQVHDLTLQLPGAGETRLGVVLLLDASKSMEGEPIAKAMEAARALATRLPNRVELSVIPFNNKTPLVLPFTNDPQRIANTLARTPNLAFGTRLYDAIEAAEKQLRSGEVDVGSVVILSDGADVGSKAKLDVVLEDAQNSRTRIFAVGLASKQFDPKTLKAFAAAGGGAYAQAQTTDDLTPIFRQLGARISSEYLVRYESFAGPGEKTYLSVGVDGVPGLATASYTAPGLATTALESPSWLDRLIQSTFVAVLIGGLVVVLVGFGVFTLVRLLDRRLETRMSRFVTMPLDERALHRQVEVHEKLEEEKEQDERRFSLHNLRWYKRLENDVDLGRIRFSAGAIVGFMVVAAVAAGVFAVALTGLAWLVLVAVIPPIVIHSLVKRRVASVRRTFGEQLPETLDVVSSALRAGHSLTGALGVAVEGAPEPSHREFGRALADERLGVPLDQALRVAAHRMDSTDLTQVSLVAQLQREAGTNVAEVLDQVSTNVRHQLELRRMIRTLTAQGRMSRWIVSLMPVGLFALIFMFNREYLSPLWETAGGLTAMVVAGMMVVLGSYIIKRIVEFDA